MVVIMKVLETQVMQDEQWTTNRFVANSIQQRRLYNLQNKSLQDSSTAEVIQIPNMKTGTF